jgi:hypothetical protein
METVEILDYVPPTLEELQKNLEDHALRLLGAYNRLDNLEAAIDRMIERIMEHVEMGDLEHGVAEDLASYFGRDLVREVKIRFTIDIDTEIVIPVGYDLDDLVGDIQFDLTPLHHSDIQIDSEYVSNIEIEEL